MVEDKLKKLDYNRKFKFTRDDGKTDETYIGAIHNLEPIYRYIWCWNIKTNTYKTDLTEDEINLLYATYCDSKKFNAATFYAVFGFHVMDSVNKLNERDREFVLDFLLKPKSDDIEKFKNMTDLVKCPLCGTPLKKEIKEIKPGIYASVMVCAKCAISNLDRKQLEQIHYGKAFISGKSLALRIPKKLADKGRIKRRNEIRDRRKRRQNHNWTGMRSPCTQC